MENGGLSAKNCDYHSIRAIIGDSFERFPHSALKRIEKGDFQGMEKTKVTYMAVDSIIPYANNPRLNDNAVDAVAASIKEFGFKVPIVVDGENVIINGHTRLKAAHKLGLKQVPVIVADDLTPAQAKAFRLADNKTSELAEWDMGKLDIELAEIQDLDMNDFGFDEIEASVDDFGTDFELPDGDKGELCQMTFTLHEKQKELVEYAIGLVKDDVTETYGNTNENGNGLYEVVRQWAELRK